MGAEKIHLGSDGTSYDTGSFPLCPVCVEEELTRKRSVELEAWQRHLFGAFQGHPLSGNVEAGRRGNAHQKPIEIPISRISRSTIRCIAVSRVGQPLLGRGTRAAAVPRAGCWVRWDPQQSWTGRLCIEGHSRLLERSHILPAAFCARFSGHNIEKGPSAGGRGKPLFCMLNVPGVSISVR